jgi:hypothetical protein
MVLRDRLSTSPKRNTIEKAMAREIKEEKKMGTLNRLSQWMRGIKAKESKIETTKGKKIT